MRKTTQVIHYRPNSYVLRNYRFQKDVHPENATWVRGEPYSALGNYLSKQYQLALPHPDVSEEDRSRFAEFRERFHLLKADLRLQDPCFAESTPVGVLVCAVENLIAHRVRGGIIIRRPMTQEVFFNGFPEHQGEKFFIWDELGTQLEIEVPQVEYQEEEPIEITLISAQHHNSDQGVPMLSLEEGLNVQGHYERLCDAAVLSIVSDRKSTEWAAAH